MGDIWIRIENELEDEGIEKQAISENKDFIYNWVEKALAAGDLDEKRPAADLQPEWGLRTRSPSPNAEVTTREKLEAINLRLNSRDRVDPPTKVSPPQEPEPEALPALLVRPDSASSHRSQNGAYSNFDFLPSRKISTACPGCTSQADSSWCLNLVEQKLISCNV